MGASKMQNISHPQPAKFEPAAGVYFIIFDRYKATLEYLQASGF
jgi:hypothetical protein